MSKIFRTNFGLCLSKWITTRNMQTVPTIQQIAPVPPIALTTKMELDFSKLNILSNSLVLTQTKNMQQSNLYYNENYKKIITELPLTGSLIHIENPKTFRKNEIIDRRRDNNLNKIIQTPTNSQKIEDIQAARLIVIRRRKMKKHKLKKLRKKMKFEWAKVRQRREMRKEKAFQAVLIAQCKEADKFSAENYVMEKLKELHTDPLPRFWKGKRLPAFIIKEKLGIK